MNKETKFDWEAMERKVEEEFRGEIKIMLEKNERRLETKRTK